MGWQAIIHLGDRISDKELRQLISFRFAPLGVQVDYETAVALAERPLVAVARGKRDLVIFDPGLRVDDDDIKAFWKSKRPVVTAVLDEHTDNFGLLFHTQPRTTEKRDSVKAVFDRCDELGYEENVVDLKFEIYATDADEAALRRQIAERTNSQPRITRLLVVPGITPRKLLGALARFAKLKEERVVTPTTPNGGLRFSHLTGGALNTARVAAGGSDGGRDAVAGTDLTKLRETPTFDATQSWAALFDASGNMVFDMRWLHATIKPARAVAVWGTPSALGFALWENGELRRRVMRVDGTIVEEALELPASYVDPVGKALAFEKKLPKSGSWETMALVLENFEMPSLELEVLEYHHVIVAPR